jgi:5-formyltetrahydrofolate cyclo-ligase
MITEKDIARINQLYHKSKAEGLTAAEKEEQAALRKAYIAAIRGNIRAQLNNIDLVDEKGNVENLGEKYGKVSK